MKSLVQFITEGRQEGSVRFKKAFDVIFGINDENCDKYLSRVQRNESLYNVKTRKPATLDELEAAFNSNAWADWEYDTRTQDLSLTSNDFEFVIRIAPSETKYVLPSL